MSNNTPGKQLTEDDLEYAAASRCSCGAGLAYPKGRHADAWDCSDVLLGRAIPQGQPGAVRHTERLPFAFWKVKSESDASACGYTTRPPKREHPLSEDDLVYAAYERCLCGAGLAYVRGTGKRASATWECSKMLLSPGMTFDSNAHTRPRPMQFHPIIAESERAAHGHSTRPGSEESNAEQHNNTL